jgi:hypothetical protein
MRLSSGSNPLLLGNCRTQTGSNNPGASFKLSNCVSYDFIGLKCDWKPIKPWDFENLCRNCRLEGTVLACDCGLVIAITKRVDLCAS